MRAHAAWLLSVWCSSLISPPRLVLSPGRENITNTCLCCALLCVCAHAHTFGLVHAYARIHPHIGANSCFVGLVHKLATTICISPRCSTETRAPQIHLRYPSSPFSARPASFWLSIYGSTGLFSSVCFLVSRVLPPPLSPPPFRVLSLSYTCQDCMYARINCVRHLWRSSLTTR